MTMAASHFVTSQIAEQYLDAEDLIEEDDYIAPKERTHMLAEELNLKVFMIISH